MVENLSRLIIITGHYGTGKTNLSVNLAVILKNLGRDVYLADLDIVNPYFRSADFNKELKAQGINMLLPLFANSNLDIPAITPAIDAAIRDNNKTLILDVGGDDAGAAALGRYSHIINNMPYDMLYVVNSYRMQTRTPQDAVEILREIETSARIKATAVVNNSNLSVETDMDIIKSSLDFGTKTAELANIPLLFTTAKKEIKIEGQDILPIEIYVKLPWDKA